MKILIVTYLEFHLECLGFLLEGLCEKHKVTLFVPNDIYNYAYYFSDVYTFTKLSECDDTSLFDLVIKLTSNEDIQTQSKTISILHLGGLEDSNENRFITLSPYVKPNGYVYKNIFPVYNTHNTTPPSRSRTIVWVGWMLESYVPQ